MSATAAPNQRLLSRHWLLLAALAGLQAVCVFQMLPLHHRDHQPLTAC